MNPFPRELVGYTAALFAAAVFGALAFAVHEGTPDLGQLLVFGLVLVYCANRDVSLPNGTGVSPALMVMMTALVVFREEDSIAGVVLVGLASSIFVRGLSRSTWGWLPFNAGVNGLGMLLAVLVHGLFPDRAVNDLGPGLLAATAAVGVYAVTTWLLIATSYAVEQRALPRRMLREFVPLSVQTWPFGLLGSCIGLLYLSLGPSVMVLIIVPVFIAGEMFSSYVKVREAHDETVHMLIRALEKKDRYTAGHSERVAGYALYMGEEFNFGPGRMERLRFAALMHDIGKLIVPNHLLNKPGRLTEEEFARIRLHEKVSVQMLSHIEFLRPIAAVTTSDAMKFDPGDEDHPVEPYMVMIADAYDAMTSTRAYRKAVSQEVAFQELRDKSGTQFHPACVEALITAIEKRGEMHGAGFEIHTEFEHAPDVGLGSAGLGDLLRTEIAS